MAIYMWREYSWTPGANTLAYRPLNSTTTVNDQSANSNNLTNTGITFGTNYGVDCASFDNNSTKYLYLSNLNTGTEYTYSIRVYVSGVMDNNTNRIFSDSNENGYAGLFCTKNWVYYYYPRSTTATANYQKSNATNSRHLITITRNTSTFKFYYDGVLVDTATNGYSSALSSYYLTIGRSTFYGAVSEFIIENKERTADKILEYYNGTKANYLI